MSTQSLSIPDSDASLVSAVALHDPDLARKVQLRLRSLRLRCIVSVASSDDPRRPEGSRHSIWHTLRWPWRWS